MSKFVVTFKVIDATEEVDADQLYTGGADYELRDDKGECVAVFNNSEVVSIIKRTDG